MAGLIRDEGRRVSAGKEQRPEKADERNIATDDRIVNQPIRRDAGNLIMKTRTTWKNQYPGTKWSPIICGRIVESPESSESIRFVGNDALHED